MKYKEVIETAPKTLVVNLFGTPVAGKSTGAAYIFSELKMRGINAELVTGFAKDKVWENNDEVFKNQAYIFGKQSYKMSRCRDKVDVIITDSPLPLSIFYNHDEVLGEDFNRTVMNVFNSYNNINFLLLRTKPYNPNGRMQTEAESDTLKVPMVNLLNEREVPYTEVNGDIGGYEQIINNIVYELDYLRHKDEICFDDFGIVPVSDKPTILDNIIDEMLDTLNYKDYNKREIEGAKECSEIMKKRLHKFYENDKNADDPNFDMDEYNSLQYCLSYMVLPIDLTSDERDGAKRFILAIKSKVRILKPDA